MKNWIKLLIVFFVLLISALSLYKYYQLYKKQQVAVEIKKPEPKFEYGINVDTLLVIKDTINSGDNISSILQKYKVDATTVDLLVKRADGIFDTRKIRRGYEYTIISDSSGNASYFIYEDSPTSFIVFQLFDSVHVHSNEKEVQTIIKSTSGEISTSLWNAMIDNGASPSLALSLSEIYAWTIDFYGIQKGDKYKMIYEDLVVDGKSIGFGKILAAWFVNEGKENYAFYYVQDSIGDYFDITGNNLKRAFLKAPLSFAKITSKFSNSRMHPVLRIRRPHHGVDYAAPRGTPVQTIGAGTIIACGWSGGGGKTIKVKHSNDYVTSYMHLSGFAPGIRNGARVSQGEVIAYVGSTGLSTGPHLDFRVYKSGTAIDPLKMESPPAKPVRKEKISDFNKTANKFKQQLNLIKK